MQGRDAAGCSKVSGLQATADSNSRNDDLERRPSPPQGPAAPHRLHPPLLSFSLLHLCHPHSSQHPARCHRKAAAPCISIPCHSLRGIPALEPASAGAQQHPDTPTPAPRARSRHPTHLPTSKPPASAHLRAQERCRGKICPQGPSVYQHPGVEEPSRQRCQRDKDTAG